MDAEYLLVRGIQPALLDATLELIYPKKTSFTGVLEKDEPSSRSVGQIHLKDESAHLVFIYPKENECVFDTCALIEGLGKCAGAMGAHFLLASTEENDQLHYALCQEGYRRIYSQKVWKLDLSREIPHDPAYQWQPATVRDLVVIQTFIQTLLPPVVQAVRPLKPNNYPDYLLRADGELCGMALLHSFADAVFIYPFLPSSLPKPEKAISSLIKTILPNHNVFVVIPSYQNWLEGMQSKLFAETMLKQLVLVKHFTLRQKVTVESEERLRVRQHRREPNTPVTPYIPEDRC